MAYESKLDEKIFSKAINSERGRIVVGVYSYNNGPKRLQINREVERKDGTLIFAKLGRLSKKEVEELLPILEEALSLM